MGETVDVVILGAGGAGMMCAIHAGRRGRSVVVLDRRTEPGGKILISGGGRCNFTNTGAGPEQFVSRNPHFARSALSRYSPEDFLRMVRDHGIPFHEKKLGQLFCDDSARRILDMLVAECGTSGAELRLGRHIKAVRKECEVFIVETDRESFACRSLVVATGGLSIPKLGASGLGYDLARQFGLNVVETAPALDGFVLKDEDKAKLAGLEGIALDVVMGTGKARFEEAMLFTHVGLSGPAALQVSLHWKKGESVSIDLVPTLDREALVAWFSERRQGKAAVKTVLSQLLPIRLAERFAELHLHEGARLADLPGRDLELFCGRLKEWTLVPKGTVGYTRAEVTRGGVDTDELSSKTMEARKVPGLYFIGEVVDVTGWLGGYNFQWAWASGWAAGQAV